MKQLLFIAVGGASGAIFRHYMSSMVYALAGRGFPYGTLLVNVIGSFLIGLLFVLIIERQHFEEIWRAGLIIGFLGALTTFSTFSIETIQLMEAGQHVKAGMNILVSVLLCLLSCYSGLLIGRQITIFN